MAVLLNVVKNIFCMNEFSIDCNKCSLCHLIDVNNLPSLKIIEPENNFIKKEQILELKNLFAKNSQYTKENIYVIKSAEKMNKESANTMLKFLEEPDGEVIGFFITSHKDNVMLTIQSRCQHIEINFDNEKHEKYNIDEEKYNNLYDFVKDYLYKIEIEKTKLILYNRDTFNELEKNDILIIFKIMLDIYENILIKKINNSKDKEWDFLYEYSYQNIYKKTNLIIKILKELNYNVNMDLLLDKFVIEMDGINNETL